MVCTIPGKIFGKQGKREQSVCLQCGSGNTSGTQHDERFCAEESLCPGAISAQYENIIKFSKYPALLEVHHKVFLKILYHPSLGKSVYGYVCMVFGPNYTVDQIKIEMNTRNIEQSLENFIFKLVEECFETSESFA